LYVEDDVDTFRLTQLRLEAKYELINAPNDQLACELIKRRGNDFFAVLMDIELQGSLLDGLGLVRAIRGLPGARVLPSYAQNLTPMPHLPLIVLTAYTAKYSELEVKEIGATHFLTKPIDFMRLNLALAQANIQSVMSRLAAPTRAR
jgi:CheY-like chemotaxis protein